MTIQEAKAIIKKTKSPMLRRDLLKFIKRQTMLINNDCLLALDELEENSVDAIVTDPPYELNFMGKGWDNAGISFSKDTWAKCLRVLKPGGYMLAFGGSRTYHRIACAIEDAGFEIRDCIMWLYGSGFPKSMNIGLAIDKKNGVESKIVGEGKSGGTSRAYQSLETTTAGKYQVKEAQNEWAGWGTALKPSYEPIIVARKPCEGSCVANVEKYGVGGINIDECRIPLADGEAKHGGFGAAKSGFQKGIGNAGDDDYKCKWVEDRSGRFPANTIFDTQDGEEWRRYFYCAKASKNDRDEGLGEFNTKTSYEPIVVARKPLDGSCVANVMKWGVGGINIDECRIETTDKVMTHSKTSVAAKSKGVYGDYGAVTTHQTESQKLGRFPANMILDNQGGEEWRRYFYCAKASKNDRDEGLEEFNTKTSGQMTERKEGSAGITAFTGSRSPKKNNHPTVKPTELMRYLVRLVTPKGGTVLDPFMGSGSTGKAVACENNERNAEYKFIGIEKEPEYCRIAEARIGYVEQKEQQQKLI